MRLARVMLFCLFFITAKADVKLPQLISNGMVLQRDTELKIWGWAAVNEKVTISFNGKSYQSITGTDKRWLVHLPKMKAGGPYTMDITGTNTIHLTNILFGDVWLGAGQSNMVINMERVKEKYPEEISSANFPEIRNFFIPTVADAGKVHDDLPASKWIEATGKNVLSFGAATYFFAKQIYEKYHVPIGIINSSVGGTPVEAWISEEGLKEFPEQLTTVAKFKDTVFINEQMRITATIGGNVKPPVETDRGLSSTVKWYETAYVPRGWRNYFVPGYWADQGIRGLNGVVWFRKEVDIPASLAGTQAKLFMGRIVDADIVYVNGVQVGNITYQYPPRRYEISAGILKAGKNTIVVRVTNTNGKGGFVPDKPYYLLAGDTKIDLKGEWQYKVGDVFKPNRPTNNANAFLSQQNVPTGLYNTMIAPFINYHIKGILWYQGEANTTRPEEYTKLLPALAYDWRNKFGDASLPFIYVQLPGFMDMQYLPSESQWATLRESQLKTLSVPNSAMVVAIDLGEWNDIHPLNKKSVGERLALAARKIAYQEKELVASGPLFKSAERDGNKIRIQFTSTGSGLMIKNEQEDELTYFAVAGADKKFVWAKAVIENRSVLVWSDEVKEPMYVRYAWADNPDGANLYNKEGLPASPFRTDN